MAGRRQVGSNHRSPQHSRAPSVLAVRVVSVLLIVLADGEPVPIQRSIWATLAAAPLHSLHNDSRRRGLQRSLGRTRTFKLRHACWSPHWL